MKIDNDAMSAAGSYIDKRDFPRKGTTREQILFSLNYAICAPSFYDSQPWQFAIDDQARHVNIYVNQSQWLRVADPQKRELHISLGRALENFLVALDHFGLGHVVAYFPNGEDGDWVARVRVVEHRESIDPRPPSLLDAIQVVQDNGHTYKAQRISAEDLGKIGGFLVDFKYDDSDMIHRITLQTTDDRALVGSLGQLAAHCQTIMFADGAFRQDLTRVMRQNIYGNQSSPAPQLAGAGAIDAEFWQRVAAREMQTICDAPLVGILTSNMDTPTALVKTGQAYERLALEAALVGIGLYPLYQLLELFEMRSAVQRLCPDLYGFPQLVLMLGYVATKHDVGISRRIPLDSVMLRI